MNTSAKLYISVCKFPELPTWQDKGEGQCMRIGAIDQSRCMFEVNGIFFFFMLV